MTTKTNDPTVYRLSTGTLQPVVFREGTKTIPMFLYHFGRAEYDRDKPVLPDALRERAQPIVDKLNSGEILEDEAKKMLDRIYW